MLWRVIEEEVVPASEELGVSQIVWSPIAQGVLTGKYKPGEPYPEGSRAAHEESGHFVEKYLNDEVLRAVQQLRPIAEDQGLTMAQLAIAWVLNRPNVASALVGASRPEQIASNAAAAGVTLPAETISAIEEAVGHLAQTDPSLTASPPERLA